MSICPEMELHSAYIDGEIASPWNDEIKTHIESCKDCSAHVNSLCAVKSIMKNDADSMSLTNAQMEESFERLQSRLRYVNTASKVNVVRGDFSRKVLPYAVAAVFLAAVILPSAGLRSSVQQRLSTVALISPSSSAELIDKTGIAADQSLNVSAIKVANTANVSKKVTTPVSMHVSNLTKIDVFKPEFSNETNPINIKLTDVTELPLIESESSLATVLPVADFYR